MGKCSYLAIFGKLDILKESYIRKKEPSSDTFDLAEHSEINFLISMTDVKYLKILAWKIAVYFKQVFSDAFTGT